jgi:hypothetical protein
MTQMQFVTGILRKSTPLLIAAVMAVGLLAGAPHGLAVTMTWTNGSDVWTSPTAWTTNQSTAYTNEVIGIVTNQVTNSFCLATLPSNSIVITNCVGGTGGFPSAGDQARFTNNTSYTVTIPSSINNLRNVTFSNTAGVVTIDASGSALTVTNLMRIAETSSTSTVVWAGGILSNTINIAGSPGVTTDIGNRTNASGSLIVTNGIVIIEQNVSIGQLPGSVGKLVVSGPGAVTNSQVHIETAGFVFRTRTPGCQLIITNGGNLYYRGEVRAESNSLFLVSDPGSRLYCTNAGGPTAAMSIGANSQVGSLLIVSNGATVFSDGTFSIGRGGSGGGQFSPFNTGIVVRAGKLITGGDSHVIIGSGSVGGSQGNNLTVYDGGYFECGGTFFSIPNAQLCTNNSFNMGGVGAVSTGFAISVRNSSGSPSSTITITNAVFTCTKISVNGTSNNTLNVLAKGILNVTNATVGLESNSVSVSAVGGVLTVNGGTLNAVGGSGNTTITIGGSGTLTGNSLIITNGGNVFADFIKVRSTNSLVFKSGTISTGGMDTDPGANNSNAFVVGDGTGAAYYDMASGGTGTNTFGSPGFVVTNNAFLRGSGTLTGTTKVLGTFVPGFANSVGAVFSRDSLSFGSSAVLNYDLGTSSDSVTIGTNNTLFLRGTLNVQDSGGFTATNYALFTLLTDTTLTTNTLTVNSLPAGFAATVSNDVPNGKVLLVVTATGGGDPYGDWTSFYGLSGANAAGGADPDGDGMSNTNEFLAGFNPTNSAASLHIISVAKTGNDMKVTYLGANGDSNGSPGPKTNVLEFTTGSANGSYSNANWLSVGAGATNELTGGNGLGAITNSVDVGGGTSTPSRYYRVRVLVP